MSPRALTPFQTVWLTTVAVVAFAFNSVLCRLALKKEGMDAETFTFIRLLSGAVVLVVAARMDPVARTAVPSKPWRIALALFGYASLFSYSFLKLEAGMGAFVLFGVMQLTLLHAAFRHGERLSPIQWGGYAVSFVGLLLLAFNGHHESAWWALALMAVSGMCWAQFTLLGRDVGSPLAATKAAFVRSIPMAAALLIGAYALRGLSRPTFNGAALAVVSGSVTSGLGYSVWYRALKGLTRSTSGIVQLLSVVIAVLAAVLLIGETPSPQLLVAGALILGGVYFAIKKREVAPPL